MSQEDVEVVRRVYEAVARRDAATVLALYDPEVEVDSSRLPEAGLVGMSLVRGHEGIRRITRDWNEAWESADDNCEELIDAGQHVIAVVTRRGRGRASGVQVETRRGGIWTIREGKVLRVVWFPLVDEAVEAAGLAE
jgi:ketosteroid isomerase-like protein